MKQMISLPLSSTCHRNQDSQWHDSDVEWHQQDQRWIESYANNIERCSNAFTERDEEKKCDYTSSRSNIKLTKHFDFERSILEVNQAIWLISVRRFEAECE